MSYRTWHDYGYGVCTTNIDTTIEKLTRLAEKAPLYYESFLKETKDFTSISEINECGCVDDYDIVASVLHNVILECEGIDLYPCTDFDGNTFLIVREALPWQMSKDEKDLTPDKLDKIFKLYTSVLSEKVDVGYQECENGGI